MDIYGKPIELSLTVPIINSLAFLFTVLGEYLAEGKKVERGKSLIDCKNSLDLWGSVEVSVADGRVDGMIDTWLGMGMVCGGIALCVHSKTS